MEKNETGKSNALELLIQERLPPLELAADGYPIPGKVVKYYRERMIYTDRDGKVRHWTQADLATQLGLKEIMVNLMENKNQGLDSIERRRALTTILKIPPILLGLGSLDLIVEIATGQDALATAQTSTKKALPGKDRIKLYQDTFRVYDTLFAEGLTYTSIHDISRWTRRLANDAQNANVDNQKALLRVLWYFEDLCSKVYASDIGDWSKAHEHTKNSLEIATILDDRDLQAASLHGSAITHFRQKRPALAKVDIEGALMYAKGALPQTKGAIYADAADQHAQDTSHSEQLLAHTFLDEAQKHAGVRSEFKTVKFGTGIYFLRRAGIFIKLERPAKALEFIDEAVKHLSRKRLSGSLDVIRARCYAEQKKPDYEEAIRLLENTIADGEITKIDRHIRQIEQTYEKIKASSYGNAPEVIALGLTLRSSRLEKM